VLLNVDIRYALEAIEKYAVFKKNFSRTFQYLELQFPGLSRTKVIFQVLHFSRKKSRTFQEAWEP